MEDAEVLEEDGKKITMRGRSVDHMLEKENCLSPQKSWV